MRARIAMGVLIGMALGLTGASAVQQRPQVDTLKWMSGCWLGKSGRVVLEEMWMPPRSGIMLGVSRTSDGARLRDGEFVRILARGDTLIYAPGPMNQASAEFAMKSLTSSEVVFENLAHDFPKRIGYRRVGDSLHAFIEGAEVNMNRRWFRYTRANCTN